MIETQRERALKKRFLYYLIPQSNKCVKLDICTPFLKVIASCKNVWKVNKLKHKTEMKI